MASWNPPQGDSYTVVETQEFLQAAVKVIGSGRAWDDVKESFDLDIARNPYIGQLIPNTHLYALATNTWPQWTIYYTIDDQSRTVTLLAVWED